MLLEQSQQNMTTTQTFSSKLHFIPTHHFSKHQSKWVPIANSSHDHAQDVQNRSKAFSWLINTFGKFSKTTRDELNADDFLLPTLPKQLKIASYNIWFDNYFADQRFHEISKMMRLYSPDIICFQEVTKRFLDVLLADEYVRENYYASDDTNGRFMTCWYGVFILSKFPGELAQRTLPTGMGRDCRYLTVRFRDGSDLRVATVHLESLANARLRREQLALIANEVLNQHAFSMCMGDFNFDSQRNYSRHVSPLENDSLKEILPDFWDAHEELGGTRMHKGKEGFSELEPCTGGKTFDSDRNANITQNEIMRYDRIMVRKNGAWKCTDLIALGDVAFMRDGRMREVFPSDHFGLMVTVERCAVGEGGEEVSEQSSLLDTK